MRKFYLALMCVACLAFTSCDLVDTLVKVSEEAAEIAEGKCFTVKEGTIVYKITYSGETSATVTTVTFKDYGKEWASQTEDAIIIFMDNYQYTLDATEKTGYKTSSSSGYSGCPYIFWENAYRYGNKFASASFKESSETIAGKKCTLFTVEGDEVIGGWCRLLFKYEDDDETMIATSFKESSTSSMFSTAGYDIQNI